MSRNEAAQAWAVSLLAAVTVAYFAWFPLMDTDIWWHLAAGRWMVEQRTWIRTDPFAADTLGKPWVDVHWLFQVLVYVVHAVGGIAGLVVAKVVLVGLGTAAWVRSACGRLARPLWIPAAAMVAFFVYPARHLMLARPTIVTLLLLAATTLVVDRVRREHDLRWAILLFPIQVLWANLQGLYLLGPGLVACAVVGDAGAVWLTSRTVTCEPMPARRVRLALALCIPAMMLAAFITPYGPRGLNLPFVLFGRISAVADPVFAREVSENLAPWLLERAAPSELAAFKWLAALTFVSFLVTIRRGLDLGKLLVCVLFFVLALVANRNVLLFLWIAAPITAVNLGRWAETTGLPKRAWPRRALSLAALCGVAAICLLRAQEAQADPPISQLAPFRVPTQAVERLLTLELPPGPVFSSDRYGGYLEWRLGPNHRPTMDGRLVLRSARDYTEHLSLGEHPENFDAYCQRHRIRVVILPTAYPDRFLPLVVWLLHQPAWRLLYTDGTETLLVHDPEGHHANQALDLALPETVRTIDREVAARYRSQPLIHRQARLHLARLVAEAGATGPAEELLASIPGTTAEALRARVAFRSGDVAQAEQLAEALLARQPDETESLCLLALIARERGDRPRALALVGRALRADPFHPLARQILEAIKADLGSAYRTGSATARSP